MAKLRLGAARTRMIKSLLDDYRFEREAMGICPALRTAIALNPEATWEEVKECFVDNEKFNPHTVRIQYRQSRALSAELEMEEGDEAIKARKA